MDSLNELIWTEEDEIMPLSLLDERLVVQACEISLSTCGSHDTPITPYTAGQFSAIESCGC